MKCGLVHKDQVPFFLPIGQPGGLLSTTNAPLGPCNNVMLTRVVRAAIMGKTIPHESDRGVCFALRTKTITLRIPNVPW